jgi:hypothetical protein
MKHMRNVVITLSLALLVLAQAPSAHALSCLPIDMYLETTLSPDDGTFVFIGTATEVKNHTQVVTVTEAVKGWVPKNMWVTHQYSDDWKYFCSNGPAKPGVSTLFFVTIDDQSTWNVVQTIPVTEKLAKDFLADAHDADLDGGITEATAENRRDEMLESINALIKKILAMITEFKYWQSEAAK